MGLENYEYYILCNVKLARRKDRQSLYEWFKNGDWVENKELSLALCDAQMDYGDYSVGDYEQISYDEAMEKIKQL
jgi:hypothetical protein